MQARHQKHTKLKKPYGGRYHSNEWSLMGAPCSIIKDFVQDISKSLNKSSLRTGYLDMSHNAERIDGHIDIVLEDKIQHWTLKQTRKLHERDYRKQFLSVDLLFVNGNHFNGQQQIVFINQKKKDSLERKLDRLTEVKLIILDDGVDQVHSFLEKYIDSNTPIFKINDLPQISEYLHAETSKNLFNINGLVLNGGKSQRMGEAKGLINYHGIHQAEYEAELLSAYCDKVYYSTAHSSDDTGKNSYPTIIDSFTGLGPYGGILSAFRHDPSCAWLTIACDLPYIDDNTISQLIKSRNVSKVATCYYNPETDFPEPLITIWEPRSYPILLDFLAQGYSCPRKVLINSNIEMIKMSKPHKMKNANTPIEKKEAMNFIKSIQDTPPQH